MRDGGEAPSLRVHLAEVRLCRGLTSCALPLTCQCNMVRGAFQNFLQVLYLFSNVLSPAEP